MGRGQKKKAKKREDKSTQACTYFKVMATFQCSRDNRNRAWNSAHAWEREDEGIMCEVCETEASLVNVVDEMLKLDTYVCPKKSCEMFWQSIHDGRRTPQQCDCGTMVSPEPSPQERFGRHYTFKCKNKNCGEKPEWEDFSVEQQKTQRCSACNSRGVIKKIQKLMPFWKLKELRENLRKRQGGGHAGGGDAASNSLEGIRGFGFGRGRSTHNSAFCDMCQDIIHQKKGRSCHQYRMIESIVSKDVSGGGVDEKINYLQ